MVKANVQQDALQACMAGVHALGERMAALESRMAASAESDAEQFRCLRYEVRVLTEMVRNLQTPPADRQSPSDGSKGSDEDGFEHLSDEARDSPPHQLAAAVAPQSPAKLPAKNSYLTSSGTVARMESGTTDDEQTTEDESQLDETEDDREPEKESTEKEHEEETETEEPKVPRVRPDQIICAKIDRRQQYLRAHQPDEGGNVSETSDEDPSYYDNILDQLPDRSNKTARSTLLSDEGSVYQSAAESLKAPSKKKETTPVKQSAARQSTPKASSPPKPATPPAAPKTSEPRAATSGLQPPKKQLPVAPSPERVPAPRTAAAPLKSALKPAKAHVEASDNNNEPSVSQQDYNNSVTAMFKAGIKPPFSQPQQQPAAQPKPQAVRSPPAPQPKPHVQEEEEEEVEQKKPPALSPPASSNSTLSPTVNDDEEVLFDEQVELWQYISEGNTPFRGAGRMKLIENLDLGSIYGLMHRASKQKPKVAEFAVKKGLKLVKHQHECVLTWRCIDTSKNTHGKEVEFLCKFEKKAHLKKFEKVVKKVA